MGSQTANQRRIMSQLGENEGQFQTDNYLNNFDEVQMFEGQSHGVNS